MNAAREAWIRVHKATDLLRATLQPFVAHHMEKAHGTEWRLQALRTGNKRTSEPLDLYASLRTIKFRPGPGEIFDTAFSDSQQQGRFQQLVSIAYDARNKVSHHIGELNHVEALNFLKAITGLAELVGADAETHSELQELCDEQEYTPNPFEVVRITDPYDRDLYDVWELHSDKFPDPEVAEGYADFQRWLGEEESGAKTDDRDIDIMLALRFKGAVKGYLYAQFFPKNGFIFVSYTAIDKTNQDVRYRGTGAMMLFEALLREVNGTNKPWTAVVGEVERVRGKDHVRGDGLFAVFGYHAKTLSGKLGEEGKLFKVGFDYAQPALRPEDMRRDLSDVESMRQTLLYFARDCGTLRLENGKYALQKDQAHNVFGSLINDWYRSGHPDSAEYQAYLDATLKDILAAIGGDLSLSDSLHTI